MALVAAVTRLRYSPVHGVASVRRRCPWQRAVRRPRVAGAAVPRPVGGGGAALRRLAGGGRVRVCEAAHLGCPFPSWSISRWPVLTLLAAVLGDRRCSDAGATAGLRWLLLLVGLCGYVGGNKTSTNLGVCWIWSSVALSDASG